MSDCHQQTLQLDSQRNGREVIPEHIKLVLPLRLPLTLYVVTKTSKKPSLFLTVARTLKWDILSIAIPRLAAVALSISQPFLITKAMRLLTLPDEEFSMNQGYGLIGAFALVFISNAVRQPALLSFNLLIFFDVPGCRRLV